MSYQWFKTEDARGNEATAIQGATSSTLDLTSATGLGASTYKDAGTYHFYCEVTNTWDDAAAEGGKSSLTANTDVVVYNILDKAPATPQITTQPADFTICQTREPDIAVVAMQDPAGTLGVLEYQWYACDENGENVELVEGATSSSYSPLTRALGTTYYYVVVRNNVNGSYSEPVKSDVVSMTVINYQVETAQDLLELAQRVNGTYDPDGDGEAPANSPYNYAGCVIEVTGDIDLSSVCHPASTGVSAASWTPIGPSAYYAFRGTFEGHGHTISGLYINARSSADRGLFGHVADATLRNFVVEGSVTGKDCVGGVVAHADRNVTGTPSTTGTSFVNVGNKVQVMCVASSGSDTHVGGIVGWYGGRGEFGTSTNTEVPMLKMTGCFNKGTITETGIDPSSYYSSYIGGLAGTTNAQVGATFENCYNTGAVTGNGSYVGGLIGYAGYDVVYFESVYNAGQVTCKNTRTANSSYLNTFYGAFGGWAGNRNGNPFKSINYATSFYREGSAKGTDGFTGTKVLGGNPATQAQLEGVNVGYSVVSPADVVWTGATALGDAYLPSAQASADAPTDENKGYPYLVWEQADDEDLFSIEVADTEHGTVTADMTQATSGDTVTLTVGAEAGYELANLTATHVVNDVTLEAAITPSENVDENGSGTYTFTMPLGDVTVSASFRLVFPISIGDVEHATVTPDRTRATPGETVTISVVPDAGYELVSVLVSHEVDGESQMVDVTAGDDGGDGGARTYAFTMPAGDVAVTASFRRVFAITTLTTEHGGITANRLTAPEGEAVGLVVTADEGYELDALSVTYAESGVVRSVDVRAGDAGSGGSAGYAFTMPAADVTATASFKARATTPAFPDPTPPAPTPTYAITALTTGHGRVSADRATASPGDTVRLSVTADEGYELEALSVTYAQGGVSHAVEVVARDAAAGAGYTFTMPSADVTVTAGFRRVFEIAIVAADHGSVSASRQTAPAGAVVTLDVATDVGYELDALSVTYLVDGVSHVVAVRPRGASVGGGYEFEMPPGDVAVAARFKEPTPPIERIPMHRLYNPNSGEHFYTGDAEESAFLASIGWAHEGIAWIAPAVSDTPVHRLYNPNAGEHHYTLDDEERDMLVSVGWNYEGTGWYSDDARGRVVYRVYNPNAYSNNHHYTVEEFEAAYLVSIGWNDEGTAWYGMA